MKTTAFFSNLLAANGASLQKSLDTPNQVTVYPGGKTFPTIQAAIDSIPNNLQGPDYYTVSIGAGTYPERVTLKPWVVLYGGSPDQVVISAPPASVQASGVLTAASNTGVNGLTVLCQGGSWGNFATALYAQDVVNFQMAGSIFKASDAGAAGLNLATAQIDLWAQSASAFNASDCDFIAEAKSSQSVATCVNIWNRANVNINYFSVVQATGGMQNYGVISGGACTTLLQDSKLIGSTYAVYLPEGGSATAARCTIDGPVSSGVIIQNTAPVPQTAPAQIKNLPGLEWIRPK